MVVVVGEVMVVVVEMDRLGAATIIVVGGAG